MISLISSALIMCYPPASRSRIPELPVETAVQDVAADLSDEPAQERMVHLFLQNDPLAEHLLESYRESLLVLGTERNSRAHVSLSLTEIFVEKRPICRDDLRQMIHASSLGDETDEVLYEA